MDAFIFDWYWYNDGPYLARGLEEGFLPAANAERLKFSLMWANHDWFNIHPARYDGKHDLQFPGRITPETFEKLYSLTIKEFEKRLQELFSTDEFVRALRTTLEASLTFQRDYQAFIEANLKGTPIVTRTEMDEVHEEMYLLRKQVRTLGDKIKDLADAD